ncbi:MAG: hypothetical protein R3362_10975, partial [Rhodothermales bacterium]|nr:hypothetical protein [Rhodothermales bacterium]
TGLPAFEVSDAVVREGEEAWTVTVRVTNTGGIAADVDLAVRDQGGAAERRVSRRLRPGGAKTVGWAVPFRPALLVVDPDARVLQRGRSVGTPLLP